MYSFGVNEPFQILIFARSGTGDIFDVSELAHNIQYSTFLHGQPGKLTFTLEKDPNNILELSLGDEVSFRYENEDVFLGYIFRIGTDKSEAYQVTAYDKLRYFANHDYFNCVDMSLVDVFNTICSRANLKPYSVETKQGANKIRDKHFCDVSYFDMVDYAIDDYLKVYHGRNPITGTEYLVEDTDNLHNFLFFVRDNFGTLELHEVSEKYKADSDRNGGALIIGTGSLLLDYKYEVDIDTNTYTQVMAMVDSKDKSDDGKTLKTCAALRPDSKSDSSYFDRQEKYGVLRKIVNIKNGFEEYENFQEKLDAYCNMVLDILGKPTKTVKLNALGVNGLYAGDGFVFQLDKLNVERSVYITAATHSYDAGLHTMSLEITALDNMPETLGRS